MDKYIFKKRKAIAERDCERLIKIFENSTPTLNPRGYYFIDADLEDIKFNFIKDSLCFNLWNYAEEHPFLKPNNERVSPYYSSWMVDMNFMIKKFLPGSSYRTDYNGRWYSEHMEHGSDECDCKRILAWMFYLNDIRKEGGTCWPQQNFTSKPRAGDLYIWPAGWTHSHYGIPAPKENKYFMSGWCSL